MHNFGCEQVDSHASDILTGSLVSDSLMQDIDILMLPSISISCINESLSD